MDKETYQYRIAAASSDGIVVNQHFGRAAKFYIYGLRFDDEPEFIEEREAVPVCQGGDHDETQLQASVKNLSDCRFVLVSRIGPGAVEALEQAGVTPMELPGLIKESIRRLSAFEKVNNIFRERGIEQ